MRRKNEASGECTTNVQSKKNIFKIILDAFRYIVKHWNVPAVGKYIPIKEIFFFCLGGMGIFTVTIMISYVTVDAGLYIAAALNMTPKEIFFLVLINTIVSIVLAPLRSAIIDNTNSKKYGKFRPHLIWLPLPIFLSFIAIGWLPYLAMSNKILMIIIYLVLFNILAFLVGLYTFAFNTLVQIISPSPAERESLISIGTFFYSLGPSILNFLFPIVANLLFAIRALNPATGKEMIMVNGYNTIGTFKYVLPAFVFVFISFGYLASLNIKERMVLPKNKALKVKFFKGVRSTFQNKYFWVINISNAMNYLRVLSTSVLGVWAATYIIKSDYALGLVNTILGVACTPGMLLAPFLIKKIGKKHLQIWSHIIAGIVLLLMIFFAIKPAASGGQYAQWQGYILIAGAFLVTLITSVQIVTAPAMMAQMYDYQQYKTGDRLEGFLSQFGGMIGSVVLLAVTLMKSLIVQANGVTDNYAVLDQGQILAPILKAFLIISSIGALLTALPYFFWDLTEKRHENIMDILYVRAKYEDKVISLEDAEKYEEKLENNDDINVRELIEKSIEQESNEEIENIEIEITE